MSVNPVPADAAGRVDRHFSGRLRHVRRRPDSPRWVVRYLIRAARRPHGAYVIWGPTSGGDGQQLNAPRDRCCTSEHVTM